MSAPAAKKQKLEDRCESEIALDAFVSKLSDEDKRNIVKVIQETTGNDGRELIDLLKTRTPSARLRSALRSKPHNAEKPNDSHDTPSEESGTNNTAKISGATPNNLDVSEVVSFIVDRIGDENWDSFRLSYWDEITYEYSGWKLEREAFKKINVPPGTCDITVGCNRRSKVLELKEGTIQATTVLENLESLGYQQVTMAQKVARALETARVSFLENEPKEISGLVQTEPERFDPSDYAVEPVPSSRSRVVIVAGEGGGGKSRYIYDSLHHAGFSVLRYSLTSNEDRETFNETASSHERRCIQFVSCASMAMCSLNMGNTELYEKARKVSKQLSCERDKWATNKLYEILTDRMRKQEDDHLLVHWLEKSKAKKVDENYKVDKLAILIDECGKNVTLARGLISSYRDVIVPQYQKLAKAFLLVLCGAGLESVITDNKRNLYGSDPMLSTVLLVKGTNLKTLQGVGHLKAIEDGSFSKVIATNARMLTLGLLDMLDGEASKLITRGVEDDADVATRRVNFFSFRFAVDYCVRVYKTLNGISSLAPKQRAPTLAKSFMYMHRSALLEVYKKEKDVDRKATAKKMLEDSGINDFKSAELNGDEIIFSVGLATRDLSKTSNALRFLACEGCATPLYAADGISFELVVACTLERFYAAQDYASKFQRLQKAWPPAAEKGASLSNGDITTRVISMVNDGAADIDSICGFFNGNMAQRKKCSLILQQGVSNAQGADVFALVLTYEVVGGWFLNLTAVQAKNWERTRYKSAMNTAALSVGFDAKEQSLEPSKGPAGYSYCATMKLLDSVANKLGLSKEQAKFSRRAIAFAYPHEKRSPTDHEGLGSNVELWSSEMLEPCISAVKVAPDDDESEDCGQD